MTKLKMNVPSVHCLNDYLIKHGLHKLISRFSCYEHLIGSSESIDFLREKYKEYKELKLNEDETV